MGPLCLVCHINDLKTVCDCVKYVDDLTMYEDCDSSRSSYGMDTWKTLWKSRRIKPKKW